MFMNGWMGYMNPKVSKFRADFSIFQSTMNGKNFIYLDTASSAQKPRIVMEAITKAYTEHYANVHRGLYDFSQSTTAQFEAVRGRLKKFVNADESYDVVFTRNTTEAINLVAHAWGLDNLRAGDEIILTEMEHHANIVPWQLVAQKTGAIIHYVRITPNGILDQEHFESLLSPRTKIISLVHISNAIGVINPVADMIKKARGVNPSVKTLVDVSQSIVHSRLSMKSLNNPDFIVFTGHKLYGPNGVGALIGRHNILESMSPYQGGGDMIETVSCTGSTFKPSPAKFEAGTPAIAEVIAFGAAIDYLDDAFDRGAIEHETALTEFLMKELSGITGIEIYAKDAPRAGIISFNLLGIHPSDIAMTLDQMGIAVRTGHHCCMPLMKALGIAGSVRVSLGIYNDEQDVLALINGLKTVQRLFAEAA